MAFKDLQDSSKPWPDDNDYFKVTIVDLDVNKLYPFQFRWQYEDKTYGAWSATVERTTKSYTVPEVTNIATSWKGTTLTITFDRPEVSVGGVMKNRAKDFIISLTYDSKTLTKTIPVDTTKTQQTYILKEETAREFWRDAGNAKFFPTAYSGNIKTVTVDQFTSTGVNFSTSVFSDPITNQPIPDSTWRLAANLDGYTTSVDLFTDATASDLYAETEVYHSTTSGGTYTLVGKGPYLIPVVYYGDTGTKHVKIRHKTKNGTYSQYSNIKTTASVSPSGYDPNGPANSNPIVAGTVVIDGDGLFDFNYKVPFSWTAESDTTTLGYRIRWRINGSSDPYTHTIVPGRLTTTTYLYGLLAGQTYEVGKNTYDEYGNTTASWVSTTVTTPAFTGEIKGTKFLAAGDMKLGYGIGGNNTNKGLYLSTNNYWYVSGNTVLDSAARIKIGSATSYLEWNGSDLTTTGIINALGGIFRGTVDVGDPLATPTPIDGQLRVRQTNGGIEIGKLSSAAGTFLNAQGISGVGQGMFAYNSSTNKYVLINAADGSIRANNGFFSGTITGSTFTSTNTSTGGVSIQAGSGGDSDSIYFYRLSGIQGQLYASGTGFTIVGPQGGGNQAIGLLNGGALNIRSGTSSGAGANVTFSSGSGSVASQVEISVGTKSFRNILASSVAPNNLSSGGAAADGYLVGEIYLRYT